MLGSLRGSCAAALIAMNEFGAAITGLDTTELNLFENFLPWKQELDLNARRSVATLIP